MTLIITFILGFLVAISSLVAQVFLSLMVEIFFHLKIPLHYDDSDTFIRIIILMLIVATIEEVLRYFIIKKQINSFIKKYYDNLLFGTAFGLGFGSFEILMASMSHATILSSLTVMFIPVFIIHIFLSIFFLLFSDEDKSYIYNFIIIATAIIIHTAGNLILFYIYT